MQEGRGRRAVWFLMRGTLLTYIVLLLAAFPAWAGGQVDSGRRTEVSVIVAAISPAGSVMAETLSARRVTLEDTVRIQILRELRALEEGVDVALAGEPMHARDELVRFYRQRNYRPAWMAPPGFSADAYLLVKVLRDSPSEGLDPRDYHMERLRALAGEMANSRRSMKLPSAVLWARMDLYLTDAFFTYASHRRSGRVGNPDSAAAETEGSGLPELLEGTLNAGTFGIALEVLPPRHAGYARLREALARYRRLALEGGWHAVAGGPSLRRGDQGERVQALRQRLAVTGELKDEAREAGDVFDEELEGAVREFQRSHGLDADGVVGRATLAELNVPVEARIGQILVNLERWRWLPEELGYRYIVVNIAGFGLDVVEDGETVMSMEAIVGKDYAQTPVFSGLMTYLVLGPSWTVPRTIAVRDKLPLILKDPLYLRRHGYRVIEGRGGSAREVDPATVDWSKLNEDQFPYQLRQEPGPGNALGRVKFMFPNPFEVYIHDTPERWLFSRSRRTFSAGCIRISKPIELAEYLLSDAASWPPDVIVKTIGNWKERAVRLPRAIPIHILYFTTWVDREGVLQFRADIYGRDRGLLEAMEGRKAGDASFFGDAGAGPHGGN